MSIPEGATHVVADIYSLRDEQKEMNNKYPYRKKDGDLWLAFVDYEWVNVWLPDPKRYQKIDKLWSGPEDGLPPVGSKCRVVKIDGIDAPLDTECKIVAHEMNGENMVAVYMHGKAYAMYVGIGISDCFGLTKAPDARETAIRELMDIAQVDCRVTAARLVDAGFKREVV